MQCLNKKKKSEIFNRRNLTKLTGLIHQYLNSMFLLETQALHDWVVFVDLKPLPKRVFRISNFLMPTKVTERYV